MERILQTYRSRDVSTSDALDWSIQVIECLALDDLCADFTAYTESRETTFYNDQTNYCGYEAEIIY